MMKGTSEVRKALTKSIVLGLTIGMLGGFNIASAAVGDPITSGDDSGANSLAIGGGTASGGDSLAIGGSAWASGTGSIVITNRGNSSKAYAANDIVIGNSSETWDSGIEKINGNLILGTNSNITAGAHSLALGNFTSINTDHGVALGTGTQVNHANSVAIGYYSATSAANVGDTAQGSSITIAGETKSYMYAGLASDVNGTVSVGTADHERQIQNVAAGDVTSTSTDAINGSQLAATNQAVQTVANNISGLSNKLNNLDSRVNKVGASSAALAALHPLDFDPDDKWDFSAGYGNYQGSNAMALGIFYRPNEDTMFSVGTTFGNGENMINAGVSFKIGGGNHISTSRVAMAKEIDALRQQVNQLTGMISGGGKAVATNFDVNKSAVFPDVPENHWAYEYVAKLAGNGIVDGYSDGEYRGDRTMTRYEMAAMLYRALIKGVQVDENMLKEFNPELEKLIQVDGSRVHVVKR